MVDVHQLHFRNKSPLVPRRSPDFEVREGFLYAGTVVYSIKDSPVLFMNIALKVVLLCSISSSSDGASSTLRGPRSEDFVEEQATRVIGEEEPGQDMVALRIPLWNRNSLACSSVSVIR